MTPTNAAAVIVLAVGGIIGSGSLAMAIYRAGRRHSAAEAKQWRAIAESENHDTLAEWIVLAAAGSTNDALDKHIYKHAGELFTDVVLPSDRVWWSASMHNLLDIYDRRYELTDSPTLRLQRMAAHFSADPSKSTPPPPNRKLPPPPPRSYAGYGS